MSKTGIYLLTMLLLGAETASAQAYSGDDGNWEVDGMNGRVYVSATLLTPPCSLDTASEDQTIKLGVTPSWQLSNRYQLSPPTSVHLILEDCLLGSDIHDNEKRNSLVWYQDQPSVMMRVTGVEEPDVHSLFSLLGDVRGVGLRLEDSQHVKIIPGQASIIQPLKPGRNDLILYAQLERTTGLMKVGDFQAVINFSLEYQ